MGSGSRGPEELRRFRADLHIHTCLSPCGELSMYPRAVVERARATGLDIIAVTDHNSTENAGAVAEAAAGTGLVVLPGLELATEEEAHILGLFEAGTDLGPLLAVVYENLPDVPSKRSFVKDQVIVDAEDGVTGFNPHCLIGATRLTVYEAVGLIHKHGGLAVASHIDREAFSIISQLGFIPPDLELDAVEVSPLMTYAQARATFGPRTAHPLVRFSDAHRPEEIGRAAMEFLLARPSLEEIRKALAGREGREVHPS
ncbi:MAG: PHP domain-containing protein [Candidatus Aminicenantales bacterium]